MLQCNLLWLGVEDYTGLWQAVAEARNDAEPSSIHNARTEARRAIESMLCTELIDLFVCQEPFNNETVEIVPADARLAVLEDEASWIAPSEGGRSVRFATTERGFAAYRNETGWTE